MSRLLNTGLLNILRLLNMVQQTKISAEQTYRHDTISKTSCIPALTFCPVFEFDSTNFLLVLQPKIITGGQSKNEVKAAWYSTYMTKRNFISRQKWKTVPRSAVIRNDLLLSVLTRYVTLRAKLARFLVLFPLLN